MKKMTLAVALMTAAAVAFVANAEVLTPEAQATKEQLAAQLGVSVDDYSLATLTQLSCRLEGAETEAEKARLLTGLEDFGMVHEDSAAETREQLAMELGVDAADYTRGELALLKAIMEDDECNISDPESYAKAGERITRETASAKWQLGMLLGVEPDQYTLSELVKMKASNDM
ncbi:MAG: hypothetical protein HKO95_08395 [Rhodobacteraceae bacterium]|nr:hypothetical protein [Alphaproteobacteria bacterium]NNF71666.1 hypothetical protein [Paracoccaceae bacterium]NNK66742.1 hypothetical protein [Paracoccaceae bacterium]